MRGVGRFVVLVFGLSLALPQAASAAFAGSTVLVSRPTGLGPVPRAFDNDSQTPGALSSDGRYAVFESQADGFAPGAHPFVQNILLGLRAEGLGAALTTLLTPAEPEVKRLLSIPDDVALAAYVLVGRRSTPWPERLARRPVESFAFAERYGQALT